MKNCQTVNYYGSSGKGKFSFSLYLEIDKKINNIKEVQVEKLIQTLIFMKMASIHDILMRNNVVHIIIELFSHQRT